MSGQKLQVDETVLNEVTRRIRDAASPDRIILFGSAATGDMNRDRNAREKLQPKGGNAREKLRRQGSIARENLHTTHEDARGARAPRADGLRALALAGVVASFAY